MDKPKFKKNIHFNREEELHVAKMINDGADYEKVAKWHMNRYNKPMHKSKFYAHPKKAAKILAEANKNVSGPHSYTRPNEDEISTFENHLKVSILERTESMDALKWTFPLLQQFAVQERMRPEFQNLQGLKNYVFGHRYWNRFMTRNQLNFSGRKSDAQPFSETELEQFRKEMDMKLMFYKKDDICNVDESGWFYRETKGRIITRKGWSIKLCVEVHLVHCLHKKCT